MPWRIHRRLCLTLLLLLHSLVALGSPSDADVKVLYQDLVPRIRLDRIQNDYHQIADFGSRLTGSAGEAKAFDYVEQNLRALGATSVARKPFKITVPDPESRGTLSIDDKAISLFPLWPNLARSSSCNATGTLIYGGDGSLEALNGQVVKGAIVLLEFDTGSRWRNAAKLGAAAIVFIEPSAMPRAEAEQKFSDVPFDVPRFFLPLKVAAPVLTAAFNHHSASLSCKQDWLVKTTWNLVAEFPGRRPSDPVEVAAFADAMSVVPGLAPGGEGIGGISGLLELARVWSTRPHDRTLRLVLSGAHGLALQGAREFVDDQIEHPRPAPLLTLTLDLSSGSRAVGSYGRGWFYEYRDESQVPLQQVSRLFRAHADRLAAIWGLPLGRLVLVDAVNNSDGRTWKNNISGKFALDCEPFVNAGMNALTFRTIEDSRPRVDTPFDTIDQVEIANVRRQLQTVVAMVHHALNDTADASEPSEYRMPLQPAAPSRMRLIGGFSVISGQVVVYDPIKSFVPDVKIPDSLAVLRGKQKTLMGVRGSVLQKTEGPNAEYRLVGAAPVTSYPNTDVKETMIEAFHLDPVSGRIDYAPSLGITGAFSFHTEFDLKTADRRSPIVVFPCEAISLFDLVDPQDLKALHSVDVMDARTGSDPTNFGIFSPGFDQRMNAEVEDTQVLFVSPGQHFLLTGGARFGDTRLVLTNSTVGDEAGAGYQATGGEVLGSGRETITEGGFFPNLPLNTAKDILAINETRLNRFRKYRIVSPEIYEIQAKANAEVKIAEEAMAAKDWSTAERHSRAAWGLALRAYPVIQSTANDVVNGVVFYLFLLIPFSYFLERLIVGNQLLTKQLAWSVGIFLLSFLFLRLIHPAFEIVSNPVMIFVAFVMGVLSLIVTSFILGKFETSLKALKQQASGLHEVDIRRSSVTMAAFNLGVSNMRRRKARTILTTLTLVVMTFIVLSFTSIVSQLQLNELPSDHAANYSGLLIRNPGLDPLEASTYRQVANEFSGRADVVRRVYYYGADLGDASVLSLQRADRVAEFRAVLGLEPLEADALHPQDALLPGGRWFAPGDRNVAILPQPLAEQLKVDPSEVGKATVRYSGVEYTVIGIVDPSILRAKTDLDGDPVLPPDFTLSKDFQTQRGGGTNQAFRSFIRLDPGVCLILPTQTALDLGAEIRSVAVRFKNPAETRKALDSLMPRLRLNLYAAVPSANGLEVRQFSVLQGSKGAGMGLILVQLAIASIFVLNTMVASVFERTKEIGIFSAIGLAPNHIAMLFFAESLVYGVLGAVIGYMAAQATAKVIVATGALPGLTLNFSSTSAVMSAGLVMGVVLLSTIYPARKASQIAAPAMNEKVFETEPEGDDWNLPLPFSIGAEEAAPLMEFLGEWLRAYEEYTIGSFVTADTVTRREGEDSVVEATAWLAPYDLGVSQTLVLTASPSTVPAVYKLDLTLHRLSGDQDNWPIVNQRFLGDLRRQFLTWRTLESAEREKYRSAVISVGQTSS